MPPSAVENPFETQRFNAADDFRSGWDVTSLNRTVTEAISRAINSVREKPVASAERKLHLLLGQAGYGKTHLFGRIQQQQDERVQFVFIPPPDTMEPEQIREYAAWPVVEALFDNRKGFAPIRLHLFRLLATSFIAYFEQLPNRQRSAVGDVIRDLADPLTVAEILAKVDGLDTYHQLADALRAKFKEVSGPVLRALVLGLSEYGNEARWWLRGESHQIPAAKRELLRLPMESPSATDVILGVATLLQPTGVPLVLCFDQLELLLERGMEGYRSLTAELMNWLQTIPNLVLTLGCFTDSWKLVRDTKSYISFRDRVREYQLQELEPDEAVELVKQRMASWDEFDQKRPSGWPFDLDSIRKVAADRPSPRWLLQQCSSRFNVWLTGKRYELIRFDEGGSSGLTINEWFLAEWKKELEKVRTDCPKPADTQESELWAAVEGALAVAQIGGVLPPTASVRVTTANPLNKAKADSNPSCSLELSISGTNFVIVVAATKKDSGKPFGTWVDRLADVLTNSVVGAVDIRPREELAVGKTTAGYKKYSGMLTTGKLRRFPLDTNEATFHQLECLRRLVRQAEARMLAFGDRILSADECRKLVADTGVIANLKLFEFIFQNWPGVGAATPPPPEPPKAPPPTPTQSQASAAPVAPPPPTPPPPVAPPSTEESPWAAELLQKAAEYLKKRGQAVHPAGYLVGPTFARLKVELRGDADVGKIRKQAENLRTHLRLQDEPLIASQPGYVSIDVQRPDRQTVLLPPLLPTCPAKMAGEPAFLVGVDVEGKAEWLNMSEPSGCHLLVAGTTGSGKSEFLKALLACLAARLTPEQIRFRLVDPKRVTFNLPNGSPYLVGSVVYDAEEALPVLEECVLEMERRYSLMQARGCDHMRHLTGADAVPRWVIVFDEFADLMTDKGSKKQLEPLLKRLGAKARASGIHLVLATQRPEASVVTPLLRSNMPGQVGLMVSSERESKLFLDEPDAAYLFGKGDLMLKLGGGLTRLQSPFVPKAEFDKYLRVG